MSRKPARMMMSDKIETGTETETDRQTYRELRRERVCVCPAVL